jgi:Chemoreceptor zinc-binding domain
VDLEKAIQAHGEWKVKLRSAIQKKTQLDAQVVAKDNACPLGQWLHGEAKRHFSALGSYRICVEKHAAFHREAGRIAAVINDGKYSEAESLLGNGTPYAAASTVLASAIVALRKESQL